MKTKKVYGAIAAKAAKMEKEIVSYAEALKIDKYADDYFVCITGYDITRDAMNFEITLKHIDNGLIKYTYIKGNAIYGCLVEDVRIDVTDYYTDDITEYGRKLVAPSGHSFEAAMVKF